MIAFHFVPPNDETLLQQQVALVCEADWGQPIHGPWGIQCTLLDARRLLAVEDGEDVVGLLRVQPQRNSVRLSAVCVRPDRQRQGIATAMVEAVVREFPAERLVLDCLPNRVRIWRRIGFTPTRTGRAIVYMERAPHSIAQPGCAPQEVRA